MDRNEINTKLAAPEAPSSQMSQESNWTSRVASSLYEGAKNLVENPYADTAVLAGVAVFAGRSKIAAFGEDLISKAAGALGKGAAGEVETTAVKEATSKLGRSIGDLNIPERDTPDRVGPMITHAEGGSGDYTISGLAERLAAEIKVGKVIKPGDFPLSVREVGANLHSHEKFAGIGLSNLVGDAGSASREAAKYGMTDARKSLAEKAGAELEIHGANGEVAPIGDYSIYMHQWFPGHDVMFEPGVAPGRLSARPDIGVPLISKDGIISDVLSQPFKLAPGNAAGDAESGISEAALRQMGKGPGGMRPLDPAALESRMGLYGRSNGGDMLGAVKKDLHGTATGAASSRAGATGGMAAEATGIAGRWETNKLSAALASAANKAGTSSEAELDKVKSMALERGELSRKTLMIGDNPTRDIEIERELKPGIIRP